MPSPRRRISPLAASRLRVRTPASWLPFRTTAGLASDSREVINQERAVAAIRFFLGIRSKGYNLFAASPVGTGKHTVTKRLVEEAARGEPRPPDWCYVHNFRDADRPRALSFPPGEGRTFARAMREAVEKFRESIPKTFSSREYEARKQGLSGAFEKEKNAVFEEMEKTAGELGFNIQRAETGLLTFPLVEGKPITPETFQELAAEEKKSIQQRQETLNAALREKMREMREIDERARAQWQEFDRYTVRLLVDPVFDDLLDRFGGNSHVRDYIEDVRADVMENFQQFVSSEAKGGGGGDMDLAALTAIMEQQDPFLRYRVNLVVDNGETVGAPVVEEVTPSYYNIAGRVEKISHMGGTYTDFTHIKAGALLRASGGYLMLNAADLLKHPFAWNALKQALIRREACIEDMSEARGYVPTTGMRPESIPISVKVVLFGSAHLYQLFFHYDEDFSKIFKVRADFETEIPRTRANAQQYARFVARVARDENLAPFGADGVAAMVEFGGRLADSQDKLSLQLVDISDMIREADHWRARGGAKTTEREHVERAARERLYRSRLVADKVQEMVKDGSLLVTTRGAAAGQVNALTVHDYGYFAFGRPSRVTAATRLGEEGIIDIERRVKLSGAFYDKGVLIISGLLGERFAQKTPLSLSTSICFEQSYGEVDGDSASAAEFYAVMSSLTGVPVQQGVAVTGSVNQKGEIQAIGGANEKIEGFYEVCKIQGFTGKQGVVLPQANVRTLMLRDDVVEAVRKRRFHVWAIRHIDEGVPLLMGMPAGRRGKSGAFPRGTLFAMAETRLREMALTLRRFGDAHHDKGASAKKKRARRGRNGNEKKF